MRYTNFFVLYLLISFAANVQAGVSHDPDKDWFTLKSKHFRIHFHQGGESLARHALAISERVHNRLAKLLNWTPKDLTDVILTDEYDVSNGYATPFPTNRMALFISAPDDINSIEDHAGWLELLITHEYLHILHLDKVTGAASILQRIFGRFFWLFPNAYQPTWLVEGLATYVETDQARGIGRGQSSYFDMLMRMEVQDGIKPLQQINQPMASWPIGITSYLYGVHYYQFLREKYGENEIFNLVNNYSDNIIPFRINSNSAQVLGKDLTQLWFEFSIYLKNKYEPQSTSIKQRGEIAGHPLTHDGYFAGPLSSLPDGRVYYVAYNGQRRPGLWVINKEREHQRLRNVIFGSRIDVHPTAGILLIQLKRCQNAALYYDLYRLDLEGGSYSRLTTCGRYRQAAWSADGSKIFAVKNGLGRNTLQLLDAQGNTQTTLWKGKVGEVISHLDSSPDGKSLVAAIWRPNSGWNLERFDISTRQWTALTQDGAVENHPQFSIDGRSVLFSSDHGGVYNIRRFDLDSGRMHSVTDVIGGAFYPVQATKQNKIFYAGYSAKGFDIYALAISHSTGREVPAAPRKPTGIAQPPPPPITTGPIEDYSPWHSLLPRWWFPHLAVDDDRVEVGAITAAWDTLQRHILVGDLARDYKNNVWVGTLDYIYDRWYPVFKLHQSREQNIFLDTNDELARTSLTDTSQAEMIFPLLGSNDFSWHIAALKKREKDDFVRPGVTRQPTLYDNLVGTAWVYNSTVRHLKSISRSEGRSVIMVAEDSDALSGSDYTGEVYTVDWREFIRLGGEHVLALRAVSGKGTRSPRPYRLGGSSDTAFTPPILADTLFDSPFNRRDYALRGYSEGRPELTGRRIRLASIEYRFPIWRLERGAMTPPIGLHQLHGAAFIDTGATWDTDGRGPDKYYTGAGFETFADTDLLYNLRLRIALGYAHGFDDTIGEDKLYLRLDAAF